MRISISLITATATLLSHACTCELLKTVVLVRNSEWGPSPSGGKSQNHVLVLSEAEAGHLLGQRLRNVYVRSQRLIPGRFDPKMVEVVALKTTRATQLGLAIANGLFEVERGHSIQSEVVPIGSVGVDDTYCLAAHPVLVDMPGNWESTLENLHYVVNIDRDLDPFDIDLVAEPILAASRPPSGVSLEFIESLQKLAKWARDAKYGDPLAARVRGGRLAFEILSGMLSKDQGPKLTVIVLSEYAFYTFQEMLVAKSSSIPARLLALELHKASSKSYLQVYRDFSHLPLDACVDCELVEVKAALQARGALIDDDEWAQTCEKNQKPAPVVQDDAFAQSLGPTTPSLVAALTSEEGLETGGKDCDSHVDFTRGVFGGVCCSLLLYLLTHSRRQKDASRSLGRDEAAELAWPKVDDPQYFIPRPTRNRNGSGI